MNKLIISIGALVSVIAHSAESKTLKFEMDRGHLKVEFADIEKDYQYKVSTMAECKAALSVKEKDDRVQFVHGPGVCQRGSNVVLQIRKDLSAAVVLQEGNLELVRANKTLSMLSQLKAVADKGTINTTIPGLGIERINSYAGAKTIFRKMPESDLPVLNLRVVTGLVIL